MRRILCALGILVAIQTAALAATPPDKIRIGWQTTWATQGQLTTILMHTDILAKNGLAAEFKGFSYGGPLNEAAVAHEVDVLFTADQPAMMLASRDKQWGAIGRLMYNRVGLFVPKDSPVRAPRDLKGKTVAVPFGAAAQREVVFAVRAAGLDPAKDVRIVNLGIDEIVALVRAGARGGRWGEIDAAATWDPTFANFESSGAARTISQTAVTSLVMADDRYLAAHPGVAARFMRAMQMAYAYFRTHREQADQWFLAESKLPFPRNVLTLSASVEPNLSVTKESDIRVWLTPQDIEGLKKTVTFMTSATLLKNPLDVNSMLRPTATAPLSK